MKHILITIGALALTAIILIGLFVPRVQITTSDGSLGLSIAMNRVSAAEPPPLINRTQTTIGDTQPSIKFACWDGESFVSIQPSVIQGFSKSITNGNTKFTGLNIDYEFKPTPANPTFNEFGGYDIFITIKASPPGNVINFTYDSRNATAYLQPPLPSLFKVGDKEMGRTIGSVSDLEIRDDKGNILISRTGDYITNSICFYNRTKGLILPVNEAEKYRAGKIGVLYRPKVFNALGGWVWADWGINGDYLTLTVSQKFLEDGPYPISIQPVGDTFGYTSTPTSDSSASNNNYVVANTMSYLGGAGTGVSMSAYVQSAGSHSAQLGVYDTASPSALIANSNTPSIALSPDFGWRTGTYVTAPTFTAIQYYLGLNNDNADVGWKYDWAAVGINYRYKSSTFGTWPSTISWDTWGGGTERQHGIYVTYTPGGTPSLTNSPASKDMGTVYPDGRAVYAKGNAPGNPVETGNCTFTIVNNGSITENITASMTNMTGGTQWTITSSNPGANTFRMTSYYAGQNPASGLVLSTSAQAFYNGLAASANISWDFKLEMPTSTTDTTQKTGTLQMTAIAP